MSVRMFLGASHIWPSKMTNNGDLPMDLAFSRAIIPERVADMVNGNVGHGRMMTYLIYRKSIVLECSKSCKGSETTLLSHPHADKAV